MATAPPAPATTAGMAENDIVCSACGKCGVEFSNRQKNKAQMKREPARCKSCVDNDTPIKNQQQHEKEVSNKANRNQEQKENTQNEQEEKKEDQKERLYFSGGESVSGESSSDMSHDNQDVSLNALKEQILGRKLVTQQDVPNAEEDSMMLPEISGAAELKKELSCAICQEPFWQPLSLTCGHSFCCECLKWWLERSKERSPHGTCPTCREELVCTDESLKVNTALRACVTALYGEELARRDHAAKLAKIKATAGENGGAHDRGFEVVSGAGKRWKMLSGNDDDEGIIFYVRRSIVLDDQDARMQLALAVDGLPGAIPLRLVNDERILQVSLCLLTMEEDEADDGGFPFVLNDEDDENLICNDARFHSTVKASFVVEGIDEACEDFGTLMPVQQSVGPDGTVTFFLSLNPRFGSQNNACIRFVHETCGAIYDISYSRNKLMAWQQVDTSRENDSLIQDAARSRNAVFLDDEDDDGTNEYEDDGFLVMHEEEVEESASESEDDEKGEQDACCVCGDHGELIICDGGSHLEGCGKSFHIQCVRREQVPPGDWICGDCASTIDLDVGLVGHEFAVNDESNHKSNKKRVLEDSSGEESDGSIEVLAPVSKNKASAKKRSRILESDSEDE